MEMIFLLFVLAFCAYIAFAMIATVAVLLVETVCGIVKSIYEGIRGKKKEQGGNA